MVWWGLLRRRLVMVTVQGWSMAPTLRDGDRVLVSRIGGTAVRPGQITVVEHPDDREGRYETPAGNTPIGSQVWMIKRCVAVAGDPVPAGLPARCQGGDGRVPGQSIVVLSDNPTHPNDSRTFGFIPCDRVLGVVIG